MNQTNTAIAAIAFSSLTNLCLLSDISKLEKKTDNILDTLDRAHLIATLYVLKEKEPKHIYSNYKEEITMKNNEGTMSNRTKVLGAISIGFTIAAVASLIKDRKTLGIEEELSSLGDSAMDLIEDSVSDAADTISDVADEVADI